MANGDSGKVITLEPVGIFHTDAVYPYDVPRQGILAGENTGCVELLENRNLEQALDGLTTFTHIWLIFHFHHNASWHAKIQPPRHLNHRVGVFASRSPYRPNGIGMSAVRLIGVVGRNIYVSGHDILDETPILDIKPYLPYSDSFPDASPGWTCQPGETVLPVLFDSSAECRLSWLEAHGVSRLRSFAVMHLEYEPDNAKRHRLMTLGDGMHALCYRTWRICYDVQDNAVRVSDIRSGYSSEELKEGTDDVYGDKILHRDFNAFFETH